MLELLLPAGPGVGKGRQIAATIFNYFCRGKTKVSDVQRLRQQNMMVVVCGGGSVSMASNRT
jgi:hypothetical protein